MINEIILLFAIQLKKKNQKERKREDKMRVGTQIALLIIQEKK
jgi:accessory gene regulator protein AgrB